MVNKRLIEMAKRQMNDVLPTERPKPKKPSVIQKPFFSGDVNYSFLEGDFGREILEEYRRLTKQDYQEASALNVLSFADNVVKGSNPFAFVLLNQILNKRNMAIATPANLERALEQGTIGLKGTYGDSGLVLRSEGDPNQYLAKNLADQVKQRGYTVGQDPVMIPLTGLDLNYDASASSNLVFQLTDSSEIIYAPQLSYKNDCNDFDKGDEKGLPIFDSSGSRTLYSNVKGGLTRLCRDWDLDLDARDDYLVYSNEVGRVVVCAESTHS